MPKYESVTASSSASESGEEVDDPDLGRKFESLPKYQTVELEEGQEPISPSAWYVSRLIWAGCSANDWKGVIISKHICPRKAIKAPNEMRVVDLSGR